MLKLPYCSLPRHGKEDIITVLIVRRGHARMFLAPISYREQSIAKLLEFVCVPSAMLRASLEPAPCAKALFDPGLTAVAAYLSKNKPSRVKAAPRTSTPLWRKTRPCLKSPSPQIGPSWHLRQTAGRHSKEVKHMALAPLLLKLLESPQCTVAVANQARDNTTTVTTQM